MTRLTWLCSVAVSISAAVACAGERDLQSAKIQFVRNTDTARASLLKALDEQIGSLATSGNLAGVVRLRQDRGEFLLGFLSADKLRQDDAEYIESALNDALNTYISVLEVRRAAVEAAYPTAIEAALAANDVDAATRLRHESESFQSGEYGPSSMEIDSRNRAFDVRRVVWTTKLALPLSDETIPDELDVAFQAQRFRISGSCHHDTKTIAGKLCGHFGRAVLLAPERSRTVDRHGYLWMGVRDREAKYVLMVVAGNTFEPLIRFEDLDLNTVYEWSAKTDRRELVFEVRNDGAVVKSARMIGNARTVFGFFATVRYLGGESDLRVAVE
jgi:hypothetical protein